MPSPFHFKQFSLRHDRCAMKVGTDGVLLGAWVNVGEGKRVLDIGTGCGVIALMLAQRTNKNTIIDAIEIEQADSIQAMENVARSPWPEKVNVIHTSLQEFASDPFELIVTNPPYFIDSLLPPTRARTQARHAQTLTFNDLIHHALRLLSPRGRLALILPFSEGNHFKAVAAMRKLFLIRETAFHTREGKPQERWLLEFALQELPLEKTKLILYQSGNKQSESYHHLTRDFYL